MSLKETDRTASVSLMEPLLDPDDGEVGPFKTAEELGAANSRTSNFTARSSSVRDLQVRGPPRRATAHRTTVMNPYKPTAAEMTNSLKDGSRAEQLLALPFPWLPAADVEDSDDASVFESVMWNHDFKLDQDTQSEIGEEDGTTFLRSLLYQTIISVAAALMSGTYFGFGLLAHRLKIDGSFSASNVATISAVLDVGVFFFRPFCGMFFDSNGPNKSFLVSCLMGGTGYLMVSFGVRAETQNPINSVGFLSFGFMLVGIAGSLSYTSALFTCTSNFKPESRSVAVSLASAGVGLSLLFFGITYHFGFNSYESSESMKTKESHQQFGNFFLMWSIFLYAVFGLGALTAHVPNYKPKKLIIADSLANYKAMLTNPTFWKMGGPFAIAMGVGMFITNNTGLMVGAASNDGNGSSTTTFVLVCLFAVIGTIARLVVGQLIRRFKKYPPGMYLMISCFLTMVGLIIYASKPSIGTLYALYVFSGLGVGSLWTPCITMLKMFAPVEAFGQSFGLMCCMPAIVGTILLKASGALYDANGTRSPGTNTPICTGRSCFGTMSWVSAALCLIAGLWSTQLLKMTRKEAKKMNDTMKGTLRKSRLAAARDAARRTRLESVVDGAQGVPSVDKIEEVNEDDEKID